jgi:hypothetical protein
VGDLKTYLLQWALGQVVGTVYRHVEKALKSAVVLNGNRTIGTLARLAVSREGKDQGKGKKGKKG